MNKNKAVTNSGGQSIEELQQRYQGLHTKKIQAETSLDHATQQLERLKQEAREKYGTDDVAQLRARLDAMTAENEQKRANYQAQLDRIERELEGVEQKFAAAENLQAGAEDNVR